VELQIQTHKSGLQRAWLASFTDRFISSGKDTVNHWTGAWLGCTASPDVLVKSFLPLPANKPSLSDRKLQVCIQERALVILQLGLPKNYIGLTVYIDNYGRYSNNIRVHAKNVT